MRPRPSRPRAPAAFTLLEMLVVITVMTILAAALVPMIGGPTIASKKAETARKMTAIEEAIMGRPDLGDPGFLSTMGRLPANTTELIASTNSPRWENGGILGRDSNVIRGWNGPYIRPASRNPELDAWGTPIRIETGPTAGTWRLRSLGADRKLFTGIPGQVADDVIFPSPETTGWWQSQGTLAVEILNGSASSNQRVLDLAIRYVYLYIQSPVDPTESGSRRLVADPAVGGPMNDNGTFSAGVATFGTATTPIHFGQHLLRVVIKNSPTDWVIDRTVTLRARNGTASVSVPMPSGTAVQPCTLSNWSSTVQACTLPLTTNSNASLLVSAAGAMRASNASGVCYVGIQVDGVPTPIGNTLAGLNPAMVTGSATQGYAISRSYPLIGTSHTVVVYVAQGGGGHTCFPDNFVLNTTVIQQ